jgi:Phage-related minor tail protein|nr:MAG TPA: minor tail protein [Caudoviricetes sp.]
MSTEEEKILNIKVKYEDAIYGILRYKEKLQELSETENKLKDDFKNGKITYDEYATTITAIGEQVKDYKGTVRELSKEVQNNIKTEKEQEGSLRSLRAELSNATKAYDSLSEAERKGAKGQELKKHINEITDKLKEAEAETQRFYRNVGNYEESIKSALGVNNNFANSIMQMASNGKGLSGVFDGAITSAKAFGSTLMGFMSNPVFLALAGIAGAGVAFKWFFDYNKGILESTRLTREFLGLTGDNLKAVRDEIQATADTYGKDYKEVLEAVDVLTSQYGYDAGQALKIINDGFQAGADLNGDMIAKIKQYAPAFHDASIGGKELVATIQQTRSGIFSDDGLSLIQMGSKKIREMSDKTAAALEGIGISSKKVQQDLVNGSMSTMDVIKMVSTKLKEVPQNSKEVGEVLKDVFGKQGANAGLKMIEQLDTMNVDLEKLKDTTGKYGQSMDKQREANAELNKTLAAMFDMSDKGFGSMLAGVKLLTTQGITKLLKGVIEVINYFIDLYNESMIVRAGVQAIVVNFKSAWNVIKLVFNLIIDGAKSAGRQLKGLAQIVEGIVTLSFDKIKEGFSTIGGSFVKTFKEGFGDIKAFGKEQANTYLDAFNSTVKNKKVAHIDLAKYKGEDKQPDHMNTNGSSEWKGKSDGGKKKKKEKKAKSSKAKGMTAEQMAKKEMDEIRKAEDLLAQLVEQTAEQRRKAIAVQYDRQIEDLKVRLATEKGLTATAKKAITSQILSLEEIKEKKLSEFDLTIKDEAIKREQTYIQNMLSSIEKGSKEEYDLKVKNIENARQLEIDAIQQMVLTEEDKAKQLKAVNAKYYKEEEEAYKEYNNRVLDEQKKAIEDRYKAKILEAEISGMENGQGSELEVLQLQADEKQALLESAQQREGETIEEFNLRKLELEKDYLDANKKVRDEEDKDKEEHFQADIARYKAIGQAMGGLSDLASAFSEHSKSLAKASKVIALGEIAVSTGVAIAEGIKQAQKAGPFPANIVAIATTVAQVMAGITSAIRTVKSAKFARGGDVVGPGTDTSDSIPAHLSNGESVMTASATRMFAPALSAFNQIGGGVPIMSYAGSGAQIGEEFLARAVARGMAMAPRPVVSVEEINNTAGRVKAIERVATIK